MPLNAYRCGRCHARFKVRESVTDMQARKLRCPKCGSRKVSWIPGEFFAVTSKKS